MKLTHTIQTQINPLTTVNATEGIFVSSLLVTVSSADNATNITCIAINLQSLMVNESEPALLLVQGIQYQNYYKQFCKYIIIISGLLESVSNLTVISINSTTVLISWSPPFTLEGVPILGYNVTIISGEICNKTLLVKGSKNMLLYHATEHSNNITFTVTVVPINAGGAGKGTYNSELHAFSTCRYLFV